MHTARGVTMTGGAVYELMDEQPTASIITLDFIGPGDTMRECKLGAVPPQQHTLDFCLRRRTLSTRLASFTESASCAAGRVYLRLQCKTEQWQENLT